MVPGEENQLVPKEVRGRWRSLGPRPADAGGSAGRRDGPPAGPAPVRARLWGEEEEEVAVVAAVARGGVWRGRRAAGRPECIEGAGGAETSPFGFVGLDK